MSTKISEYVYNCINYIQFTLLPGTCVHCRKPSWRRRDLCIPCEEALPVITHPCPRCGLPLPPGYSPANPCGTCMAFPPPFSRLVAPLAYRPPVSSLISAFKYHGKLVNGRVLAEFMCRHLHRHYGSRPMPSLLVPMPLHGSRQRGRGFNQAAEIGRHLSRHFDIPMAARACSRVRPTENQMGLNARQRRLNIRRAFRVNPRQDPGEHAAIAIIDDVVTTGATVSELAGTLLKAGARDIHVWALARTCL